MKLQITSLKEQIAQNAELLKALRDDTDQKIKLLTDRAKNEPDPQDQAPAVAPTGGGSAYPDPWSVGKKDRKTFVAMHDNRGTSAKIPEAEIIKYCSDKSGCEVVVGMHNWDNTGRVASRSFHFFYNKDTKVWRSEAGDPQGTKNNGVTEHINDTWACHFMDGQYADWHDTGDHSLDFGLLSGVEFIADCFLTLIM